MNKNILIIGAPRCGKTTLAKKIVNQNRGVSLVSMDSLISSFEAFPELKQVFPFEQMSIIDEVISATDFYGRRFIINPKDGKILSKDIVK